MNEELAHFFPERDHLRRFPDDAYPAPRRDEARRRPRRRSQPAEPIRLRVFVYGVLLGVLAVALISLVGCTPARPCDINAKVIVPCVITPEMAAEQNRQREAIQQEQYRLLEQQHKGLSEAMRDFRFHDSKEKQK